MCASLTLFRLATTNAVLVQVRAEWSAKEIADEMNSLYSTHTVGAYVATCALFDLSKNEQWVK